MNDRERELERSVYVVATCDEGRDPRSLQSCVRTNSRGRLRERLDALPLAAGAELLHVLMLPDFDRPQRIGEFWGHPETRTFGELLIDLEEDKAARAVVFGLLAEMARRSCP
jgi:hypothetical protein